MALTGRQWAAKSLETHELAGLLVFGYFKLVRAMLWYS